MRKLYYFLIGFVAVCMLALTVNKAYAQGGSSCGFIKCLEHIAGLDPGDDELMCLDGMEPPDGSAQLPARAVAWRHRNNGTWSRGLTFPYCNCTQEPDLPAGSYFTKASGKMCVNGCLMKPDSPSVKFSDFQGHTVVSAESGFEPDGNVNCNPFDNEPEEEEPPPNPVDCDGEAGDEVCIPADQNPPEFCVEVGGERICVGPDDGPCSGDSSAGYLCSGNPPDEPPPPPETRPDPNNPSEPHPPTSSGGPNTQCNGAGACSTNNWEYTPGGGGGGEDPPDPPDDGEEDPPEEGPPPGGLPGLCPDGSAPQQGQCPAPVHCPGGVSPVNGQCPNGGLQCPVGTLLVEGQCSDGSDPEVICPAGTTANPNGTCTGIVGTCPNGAQPVNGMCNIASQCDPETDPDQCEGDDEGHASGGQLCTSPPACVGHSIFCALLQQQWRTRCAVESLLPTTGPTEADYGETVQAGDAWGGGDEPGPIDSGGWLGGGGGGECPDMGAVSFAGEAFAINDWIPCSALRILAAMILAGGFAQAAYILGRG